MRINESTLRRIIREEARRVLGAGSSRINESDFEDEDTDDEDTDDEEDDFDDDGKKYPGERRHSPDELDQLADDAEADRRAFDADDEADEEDSGDEANIPGMTGETDEYYIAAQIVDLLGDNAAQNLYDDCMYDSNSNAYNELEDYIEDFGGGLFDGSDEWQQEEVLRAIAHTLRGAGIKLSKVN